jgi:hypothetical protein
VALIQKSDASPWNGPVAQSERAVVRTLLNIASPSDSSIPAFNPGLLIGKHHEAGLIIQVLILRLDSHSRGKATRDPVSKQMTSMPGEYLLNPQFKRCLAG